MDNYAYNPQQAAYNPQQAAYNPQVQQQTVVVVGQPQSVGYAQGQPQNIREWTTDLCSCCEDCGGCAFAFFCYHCFMCNMASKMDECVVGPLCLGSVFVIPMRTKLRAQFGIRGSICKDVCTHIWCDFCAVTQMYREMKHVGMA